MIRTPPGWGADIITHAYHSITHPNPAAAERESSLPVVQQIGVSDLRWAIARGLDDFGQSRTDVIFLAAIYPLLGLLMARVAFGYDMLPLMFPLASGFALVGPFAAVGLNEMSRRREQGTDAGWAAALGVINSPSIGGIVLLGAILIGMFLFWMVLANMVYNSTLGPLPPESIRGFVHDVMTTDAGWAMAAIGVGSGFVLAVIAMTISVVSFPMMLDRNVSLETAIRTSAMVVWRNPTTMAAWGIIVAVSLVIGSIPMLLGLIFVVPVLGHATWHLYRRAVVY